jgi:transposase
MLLDEGIEVFNVDNLKLKRFKDVFQGEWKTDQRDARMLAKILKVKDSMDDTREKAFNRIDKYDLEKERLKILSRHYETLTHERVRLLSRLKKEITEICPEFLDIVNYKSGKALNILKKFPDFSRYKKLHKYRLVKMKGIGESWAEKHCESLRSIECTPELAKLYAGIIQSNVKRILEIKKEQSEIMDVLEKESEKIQEVRLLKSIPGVGTNIACRLLGEIGNIERFGNESKLASYCGVACSEHSSGKMQVARMSFKCNRICKNAMTQLSGNVIRFIPESKKYYDKKRAEGKRYNHALRCVGRQMIRVIYKMLKEDREYIVKNI